MPAYRCDVLMPDGSPARRRIEAASSEAAEAAMRAAGQTPVGIAGPTPSLAAKLVSLRHARPPANPDAPPTSETPAPGRWSRGAIAALLLLSIPWTTALLATALAMREVTATARLERMAAPRLRRIAAVRSAAAARPGVVAAMGGRTVSETLDHIAATLPAGAALVSIARDDGLRLEVETDDPEALRAALAGDALLGRLRTTGETSVPDRGVRVTLGGPS